MRYRILKLLMTFNILLTDSYAVGPGDIALVEIAMNTLNSVRELNHIVTEQREFNENFERVYEKVDQGIWKADRTALWLEDIRGLKESKIENFNDFNSVLKQIKNETEFVRKKLVEQYNQRQESKRNIELSKREQKRDLKRITQYSSEAKSSLSPNRAQVETARNTKDLLIEITRLNSKVSRMSGEISKLSAKEQLQEERYLRRQIKNNKSLRKIKKGILTKRDVKK